MRPLRRRGRVGWQADSDEGARRPRSGRARVIPTRPRRATGIEDALATGSLISSGRDRVLSADIAAIGLADLMAVLNANRKSGYLLFVCGEDEKAVYLSRGEVVFAESNLAADRLGASLLRGGAIDQAGLALAERRYRPGTRFGRVVVELGLLTPRELWNGVKAQVEEIVRSLFGYADGWVHFWEGELEPDNVVRLNLPSQRLVAEGLARREALGAWGERLQRADTRLVRGQTTERPRADEEGRVFDALANTDRFAALIEATGLGSAALARTLQFLTLTGHALIVEQATGPAAPEDRDADDEVVRESVMLHVKLMFELVAPLIALEGAAPVAERLNGIVEDSALRGLPLLEGARFNASASIDPSWLEARALALPGDRTRAVEEALGEIVAYLEFELRNHPAIDDCVPYLEAVDPLRAMLRR